MSPKRIIIAGTMAFTITMSSTLWPDKTNASASYPAGCVLANGTGASVQKANAGERNDLLGVLGLSSDEQIYDALHNGKSLADIAFERNRDVQAVIELQMAEMTEQLDLRLENGSLTPHAYEAYKAELADIITKSVYGQA